MSDDDRDDSRKVGLWVVFTSVAVLLLGVLGFAVTRSLKSPSAPAAPTAVAAASGASAEAADVLVDLTPTGPALAVLYFETGSASVGAEDAAALAEVVKALAGDGAHRVLLSGYHDSTGDPAMNAELAKQRAIAVADALKALGVPESRLELKKPEVAEITSGSNAEARRVEVTIED